MAGRLGAVTLFSVVCLLSTVPLHARHAPHYNENLWISIKSNANSSIRFMIRNQVWARGLKRDPNKSRVQPFAAYCRINPDAPQHAGKPCDISNHFSIQAPYAEVSFLYTRRPAYLATDLSNGYKGEFTYDFKHFCDHSILPPVTCT